MADKWFASIRLLVSLTHVFAIRHNSDATQIIHLEPLV